MTTTHENKTFLNNQVKQPKIEKGGCCYSRHTKNCCFVCCLLGALLLLVGVVVLAAGRGLLMKVVLSTMPLKDGSDRFNSWLNPPVQPYLTGYAFNVTNPDEVLKGMKPVLQEVGPFVYKAVTVKNSRNNIVFNEDGETLTYRPRKFYFIDLEKSISDPDKTFLYAPNIPLLTALSDFKNLTGYGKTAKSNLVLNIGRGTPFINVSFSGLLWGYEDDLPCLKLKSSCPKTAVQFTEDKTEEPETDDDDEMFGDDDFFDFKRKKRSVEGEELPSPQGQIDLNDADFEAWEKGDKAGFEDCTCKWGLFRDRNVTLRKPVTIYHGMSDLSKKGLVKEFDSSPNLNWWVKDSKCDKLGGQDGGTFPPGIAKDESLDIFISLMCRRLDLVFEKEMQYPQDLVANRYVPPPNAMGSHTDKNPERRNEANACYCVDGFKCLRSGVLNMAPCKRTPERPTGAPLALSYPHFYQADPHYLNAVEGLSPDKERHQFYVDLSPEFGFPLAIRPRFQLNLIINRDEDIPVMSKLPEELVLPFLWAQDGFDHPSEEMAGAIRKGLDIPSKYSRLLGVILLAVGGGMLISSLVWILWERRARAQLTSDVHY